MRLNRLALLPFLLVPMAANAMVIYVNTFADENGENPAACSLREAIKANNDLIPFGGCPAGSRAITNNLLLEKGTYKLTHGELVISREITINGAYPHDNTQEDAVLNTKPRRQRPITTIDAGGASRIFNTAKDRVNLTITHLQLSNGVADRGGAIRSGGVVTFNNAVVDHNSASVEGGAIYLEGQSASFNSTDSTFSYNQATGKGAVVSMSCISELINTLRGIDMRQTTFADNGSLSSSSVFDGCGTLTLTLEASTIARNTASSAIFRLVDNLGPQSRLITKYSTLVQNSGSPVFLFGNLKGVSMQNTLLAFNSGTGCAVDSSATHSAEFKGLFNVMQQCPVPSFYTDPDSVNLDTANPTRQLSDELEVDNTGNGLKDYGGLTLTYLPKKTSLYLLDKTGGAINCVGSDQRGVGRVGKCDIGAVERLQLTAQDDLEQQNSDTGNRVAEADVLANDTSEETMDVRGNIMDGSYKIVIEPSVNANKEQCTLGQPDRNKNNIVHTILFDSKGVLTGTSLILCKYHLEKNGLVSNTGTVSIRVINKAPQAVDDKITLEYGSPTVSFDVLSNDNDDKDGGYTDSNGVYHRYGGFYSFDPNGKAPLNVQITKQPTAGYLTAENQGVCPFSISSITSTQCYGGKITYHSNNTYSPFGDTFTYVVFDNAGTASNEATVTINNTAPNPDAGGNGGALNLWTLGVLSLAWAWRRRRLH